jgi:ribosomal protein L35
MHIEQDKPTKEKRKKRGGKTLSEAQEFWSTQRFFVGL